MTTTEPDPRSHPWGFTWAPRVPEEALQSIAEMREETGCDCRPHAYVQILPTSQKEVGKKVIVLDHTEHCHVIRHYGNLGGQ